MRCPICMCDLYENPIDLDKMIGKSELDNLVSKSLFDSVVMMNKCKDHLFHLDCLEAQLGAKDHLCCSICMFTYGI